MKEQYYRFIGETNYTLPLKEEQLRHSAKQLFVLCMVGASLRQAGEVAAVSGLRMVILRSGSDKRIHLLELQVELAHCGPCDVALATGFAQQGLRYLYMELLLSVCYGKHIS
jgi:hypothetical protein